MKLLCIGHNVKEMAMGRKSPMLDHSYQFSTRQYEMLRTNEDNGMIENKSVPAGEESTKRGMQGADKDTKEDWRGQGIEIDQGQ